MPDLSIIVPVYNEEDSLVELHRQISTVEQEMGKAFEVVFVDDGSSDNSWNVVKKLATANDNVKSHSLPSQLRQSCSTASWRSRN